MNKKQRLAIIKVILTILLTIAAVVGMTIFKDIVIHKESMLAMSQLSSYIKEYRSKNYSLPGEYEVEAVKTRLEGSVRLGRLHYRAKWINFGAADDTILAYVKKDYFMPLVLEDGYIVLKLNGKIEWMNIQDFEKLLQSQQTIEEKMTETNGEIR
jgi:hypothetical protein